MVTSFKRLKVSHQLGIAISAVLILGSLILAILLFSSIKKMLLEERTEGYTQQTKITLDLMDTLNKKFEEISKKDIATALSSKDLDPRDKALVKYETQIAQTSKDSNYAIPYNFKSLTKAVSSEVLSNIDKSEKKTASTLEFVDGEYYFNVYAKDTGSDDIIISQYKATNEIKSLKQTISQMKVGSTGYFYVYSTKKDNAGVLLLHPKIEGKSLLEVKSEDGKLFMQDMIKDKKGVVYYDWKNKDEQTARNKFAVFNTYESWGWGVAASAYTDELTASMHSVTKELLVMQTIVAFSMLLVLYLLVKKLVQNPINDMSLHLEKIKEGILPQMNSSELSKNEISNMNVYLTIALNSIKNLIQEAKSSSVEVSQGAQALALANQELSSRTESQAATVEETSAAIVSISNLGANVAENAKKVDELTKLVKDKSEKGVEAIKQTAASMIDIKQSAQTVCGIVSTIEDIAAQTNLLALNATIEAARAGEAGRGFAVVAQEVRNLAAKSRDAAKEISELSKRSISATNEGNNYVNCAQELIIEISDSVENVKCSVEELKQATSEQANSIEEVVKAISGIDQITQQNASMVEEISTSAINLTHQSNTMEKNVGKFTIE